ncbi:MAG: c-type cytochrome [Chitinophagaceae bacterium]|nr:MAG: c-type cytochrome [Chitinophagaceae bacterium]
MNSKIWMTILSLFTLVACSKEVLERFGGFLQPANFPAPVYRFRDNKISQAGFELGRKLFYEPRFSRNNTVSCGSCHIQSAAFTQHGHEVSHGIDDRLGRRNSPPIMNLAWMNTFMWDGGVFDLDLQPIVPITAHEEMDETIENALAKLRTLPAYAAMYKKAFGDTAINTTRTMKALSQFMLLCISSNSKYDSVQRNQGPRFSDAEQRGYIFFQANCTACHREPLITDYSFRNNGIATGINNDQGRYEVTLNETDRYKFKVPSLRNLSHTAPYMHDGRFITLDAVLDHYRSGIRQTPNLDPLLANGIAMTDAQKADLLQFLNTLNDPTFLRDSKLSEQ